MAKDIWNCLIDSGLDSLRLIPFLFITYLLMEYLEHKTGDRTTRWIRKAGKSGPVWGGILGVIPQCGFSAAAASLYAGRLITVGTLLAVFLSTSDEMLPVLISEQAPVGLIFKILGIKVILGIAMGLTADLVLRFIFRRPEKEMDVHAICEQEHCHCEETSMVRSALEHTLHIVIYIFLISLVLNLIIEEVGTQKLASLILDVPLAGQMAAALVGLIPNCASSVLITQLYLEGVLGGGAMMAGLLSNAGVGLMVLFRIHRNWKKNMQFTAWLYGISVFWGVVIQLMGIL